MGDRLGRAEFLEMFTGVGESVMMRSARAPRAVFRALAEHWRTLACSTI
jgi:hypothetical protein